MSMLRSGLTYRAVIEGILGQHMTVQTTILDYFVSSAEAAGWTTSEIDLRLQRIVDTTTIGEIRIVDPIRGTIYSNIPSGGADQTLAHTPHFDGLGALLGGSETVVEHPTSPRASDGTIYKYVTMASRDSSRLIQVGVPIESSAGNLLYSVYQQQADILVRSRNLQALLGIVNLEGELAAVAPRAEMQTGDEIVDTAGIFVRRGERIMENAMAQESAVSRASLSLFSPDDRGIVVASPIVNAGGILIGGLAMAVSLDDIALAVRGEARNTALIAFALLGFTALAALFGTRLLTHPIEIIADAARQVETGEQPDPGVMEPVTRRSDEDRQPGTRLQRHDGPGLQPRGTARDAGFGKDPGAATEQPSTAHGA